uniref:Integrin alpha-2 domain-containing protein n=1 Tax=Callorhinchus milii TaxID=7868 RepID=A0A4W3H556_CALMI
MSLFVCLSVSLTISLSVSLFLSVFLSLSQSSPGAILSPQTVLTLTGTLLTGGKPQDARLGFTLAAVPDLNYDTWNDVLVGAPLEDGHRGAVYVYHGDRHTILPVYKQRIAASELDPGLRYFGRSADGQMDLDGDGLLDIAVGALGRAVVIGYV